MDTFEHARADFDRHVARFRGPDGSLPFALAAKFAHTGEVCEITEKINEAQAQVIARDICNRIEKEMTYPGQIKVTIIRETRSVEYAK